MKLEGLKVAAENRLLMLVIMETKGNDMFWKSRLRADLSYVPKSFILGYGLDSGKGHIAVLIENKFWHLFSKINTFYTAPENLIENPKLIAEILHNLTASNSNRRGKI